MDTLFKMLLDTPSWALLVGVVTPLLVSLVNQPSWSPTVKQVVAVAVAVVLGALGCLAEGQIAEGQTLLQVVAVIAVASHVAYKTLFSKIAPALERKTSRQDDHDLVA